MARAQNGRFLLRIEDIDRSRARPEWEDLIYDDLSWLGLRWEAPVIRQSDRTTAYDAALTSLWEDTLLYPCTCTRRDIEAALAAPQEGDMPVHGPDGPIYPGTCRGLPRDTAEMPKNIALRLDMRRALRKARYQFRETGTCSEGSTEDIGFSDREVIETIGDVVLARRDMGTSYHLSVVIDDAAQGVTHVVRGADLFEATKIHVVLQDLLGLPTPIYHHHRLIRDTAGKRLAKRDDARAIQKYRAHGATPQDIRRLVGLGT